MTKTTRPRVLVVDDEPQIRRALRVALRANGYDVLETERGQEAIDMVALERPDLVILDLALPDLDGVEVCRRLREWTQLPIIILSAHGDDQAKVRALDEGADDFVTKPFSVPELLARMRVASRHASRLTPNGEQVVRAGDVEIDLARRVVTRAGAEVHLTPTEYGLLRYLAQHPGRVITRGQLLRSVMGPGYEDATGNLRVYIVGLRKKLEADPSQPRLLVTEPSVGYPAARGMTGYTPSMGQTPRVLVVDDEPKLAQALKTILAGNGFEALVAETGEEALALLDLRPPDLVLLDLFLPGMDGLAVCRAIRQDRQLDVPIVILSAQGDEDAKVEALDLGADDYLTKPFGAKELLARMRAALRRAHGRPLAGQSVLEHGAIRMELERREVTVEGRPVHLTPKEYQMLHFLLVNAGKLVTHGALLREVWGPEYADASPYLHVFVRQLRQKIEPDPHHPRYIVTRPGVGYRLADL